MPKTDQASLTKPLPEEDLYAGEGGAAGEDTDYDDSHTQTLDEDTLGFHTLEEQEPHLNVLYYGEEGTGKSTHAAWMANLPDQHKSGRILVINAEGGAKKLALKRLGVDTSRIVLWPPAGERVSFDGLRQVHRRLLTDLETTPGVWTGVVMDSLTEIALSLREYATEGRQRRLDSQNKAYDPDFVDIGDYGVQTGQMQKILRRLRDLPCHFVATALQREDDNGKVGPAMNPALADSVAGYVDLMLYTRASEISSGEVEDDPASVFRALTRQNAKYRAKDRFGATPKVLAEPTFPRVFDYVMGNLDEDSDPLQVEYREREAEAARQKAEEAERKAQARAEIRKKNARR